MFPVSGFLLVLSFLPQSFGNKIYNYSFGRHYRGNMYKMAVLGINLDHTVSLWAKNNITHKEERRVMFDFWLKPGDASLNTYDSIAIRQEIGNVTKLRDLILSGFPRNRDSLREFVYYFSFYIGASYFSIPTTDIRQIHTVIFSTDDWWPHTRFTRMMITCHRCEEIYFSRLNWGTSDSDLNRLYSQAQELSPYYKNNYKPHVNPETVEQLKRQQANNMKQTSE